MQLRMSTLLVCTGAALLPYVQAQCTDSGVVRVPTRATVSGGLGLSPDNKGEYIDGLDYADVNTNIALNLWAFQPTGVTGKPPKPLRSLSFNLSQPVGGAANLGTVVDAEGGFHAFYKLEAPDLVTGLRLIRTVREMQVGETVDSARVEMILRIRGVVHLLILGGNDWPKNFCAPQQGALVSGPGTTPVKLQRVDATHWHVWTVSGSVARLWNYKNTFNPIDKGLYNFSLDVTMTDK